MWQLWLFLAAFGVSIVVFSAVFQHEKGRFYRLVQSFLVFFIVVLFALAGVDLFGAK